MNMGTKIVDLFSGPGGLGEGFAALDNGKAFSIAVSAEMETSAHNTLTLRAFFRLAASRGDRSAKSAYYNFCNSSTAKHPSVASPSLWKAAEAEAKQLTLGDAASNEVLDRIINERGLGKEETVLIGGPPCQAYSLVGRARNKGKTGYAPEADHRHYLYREYLRILASTRPAVFVMENVKGILSSKVGGRHIFHDILNDLCDPVKAISQGHGPKYVIHSLVNTTKFESGMDASEIDARDFIVHAEDYGIPQARHRVILLGVREDIDCNMTPFLKPLKPVTVRDVIGGMPEMRSRLKNGDSSSAWRDRLIGIGRTFAREARGANQWQLAYRLDEVCHAIKRELDVGGLRVEGVEGTGVSSGCSTYEKWVRDSKIHVWLNHETRSHMDSDLGRYLYAAVFAELNDRSPKGHREFALNGLAPAHANWESGKFADRFKVQRFDMPSTTVTSHIAKDGHYFIHPDPAQCRSLTVREAARLQTFPDNYFFQGNRTQQYHQVGNAVPPLLANKIAVVVKSIIQKDEFSYIELDAEKAAKTRRVEERALAWFRSGKLSVYPKGKS
jgi:DNA (cytosine-5)-methyltransferase 1